MAVSVLREHAVAGSTLRQRRVGMNKWFAFCGERGINPILQGGATPYNLDLAEAFLADAVITQGLQGDTARGYLLTVAAAHKALRLPNPVDISRGTGDWTLKQAVQAGTNIHPAGGHKRAPFAVDHICAILASKQFCAGVMGPTYSALSAASYLGMARAQAFTSTTADLFDMFTQITRGDVAVLTLPDGKVRVSLFLPAGKANPCGRELVFESTGHIICAATSIVRMLEVTPEAAMSGPLFVGANGGPITYRQWYNVTRKALKEIGLPTDMYGLHSYRRGGATALYNQTRDIELVESVGGWSHLSGTAWSYVEEDQQRLAAQSALITTAGPVQVPTRIRLLQREKRLREEEQ